MSIQSILTKIQDKITIKAIPAPDPARVMAADVSEILTDITNEIAAIPGATEESRAALASATLDYSVKFQHRDTSGTLNITSISNAKRDAKGVMVRLEAGTVLTFAAGLNVEILTAQDTTAASWLMLQCVDKNTPLYVASFAVIGGAVTQPPANTTPAAPTFTAFDDTANTVTLVPDSGVPMADYRYTLTGDATVYTVDPSGVISVGDVATTVTAYSIAATGRNQSPNATQAFTASVPAPITPDAPANPVTDDTADEFKADVVPGYTNVSDYEIEIL